MRKFDCNSFRITGNTNFEKKLTSFVSKLSLDLLSFLPQNDSLVCSLTSTFDLCISSVYFIVRRGDLLNLPKFYRAKHASSVS